MFGLRQLLIVLAAVAHGASTRPPLGAVYMRTVHLPVIGKQTVVKKAGGAEQPGSPSAAASCVRHG